MSTNDYAWKTGTAAQYPADQDIAPNPFYLPPRSDHTSSCNEIESIDLTTQASPPRNITHNPHYARIASTLEHMLDTYDDQQLADYITHIPDQWTWVNPRGKTITKRQLQQSKWGAYKSDDEILDLQ